MRQDPYRRKPSPIVGGVLLAVGGLWLTLTGLCTSGFVIPLLLQITSDDTAGLALLCLVIGVIASAPGLGLLLVGRWLRKP